MNTGIRQCPFLRSLLKPKRCSTGSSIPVRWMQTSWRPRAPYADSSSRQVRQLRRSTSRGFTTIFEKVSRIHAAFEEKLAKAEEEKRKLIKELEYARAEVDASVERIKRLQDSYKADTGQNYIFFEDAAARLLTFLGGTIADLLGLSHVGCPRSSLRDGVRPVCSQPTKLRSLNNSRLSNVGLRRVSAGPRRSWIDYAPS